MRRTHRTNNEAMSTEDFLRELFKNGDRGEMDFLQRMPAPNGGVQAGRSAQINLAAQNHSTGWNEADHPRDDIGQFTFKEGGGRGTGGSAGDEKRGKILLAEGAGEYDPEHWPGAQAWDDVTRQSRQWEEAKAIAEKHPWDREKALRHVRTHAEKDPKYLCARYVRQAIEAGGIRLARSSSAYGYGPSLEGAGFVGMPAGTEPQAGDVAIFPAIKGHPDGHMTIFNGSTWYSDFPQKDIYAGEDYRKRKAAYTLYRRPKADGSGR